jgi:hypothetical protein
MRGESFYHVGMVVPVLEPALGELGELLGLSWRPILDNEVPVRTADGTVRPLRLRFAYSEQAPYLEVIEAVPDSPWQLSEGSNLHHIGFWAEDLAAESGHLTRAACPIEAGMVGADGQWPVSFTYHRAQGIRIELADRVAEPFLFPDAVAPGAPEPE